MRELLEAAGLQLRVARRLATRRGVPLRERVGPLDDRFAGVIGSVPGFIDLGEVAPLKSAIPELAGLEPDQAASRLIKILSLARRVGLVGSVRPVEQTPEMAHLVGAAAIAFPQARFVHIVRDGRDVVCSLLEKRWLKPVGNGRDDAGVPYGSYARFWVEPEHRDEFEQASDVQRAAWAWRRYVTAARAAGVAALELRYEDLVTEPDTVAETLAAFLEAPIYPFRRALGAAHSGSVGRYRSDLSPAQLAEVLAEAGPLLTELGYA
jgi:hypothetical protein